MNGLSQNDVLVPILNKGVVTCPCFQVQTLRVVLSRMFDNTPTWYNYINVLDFIKKSIGNWLNRGTSRNFQGAVVLVNHSYQSIGLWPLKSRIPSLQLSIFKHPKYILWQSVASAWSVTFPNDDTIDILDWNSSRMLFEQLSSFRDLIQGTVYYQLENFLHIAHWSALWNYW